MRPSLSLRCRVRTPRRSRSSASALTAPLQVTGEYGTYDLGLRRHDDGPLVHGRITERDRSADPDPFALRCRDLVAHPFADHLALELGERQQDIEREPP